MKPASAGLNTHLNGNVQFRLWDLYSIDLLDGITHLRWTEGSQNVTINGSTFTPGPVISRGQIRWEIGPKVNDLEVTFDVGYGTLSDGSTPVSVWGTSLPRAASLGAFDGAAFRIDRLFMSTFGDITFGSLPWFVGQVATAQGESNQVQLTVREAKDKLNSRKMPGYTYQPLCAHALYDGGCQVVRVPVGTTAAPGSTVNSIVVNRTDANNAWQHGTVMTALGEERTITASLLSGATNILTLGEPLRYVVPASSDALTLLVGCDKSLLMCTQRFANQLRFRGFPFVPKPESVR